MTYSTIVPQPSLAFNRQHASEAHQLLYERYYRDPYWRNALVKAWTQLQNPNQQWDGRRLLCRSSKGVARYVATINGCDCRAGLLNHICWHVASCHVLTVAAELAQTKNN